MGSFSVNISNSLATILWCPEIPFSEKIVVHQQPIFFAMHLLTILNAIFCTAQVLLPCVKICLLLLHNYSEIDSTVFPIRKKLIGSEMVFLINDFDAVMFFQYVQSFISLSNCFC